jgi:hypothetical protein
MIKRLMAVGALAMLAACGGDGDGDGGTNPTPPAPTANLAGRWTSFQLWTTQFNRTRDGYNGSYTCPGTMTIVQDPASSNFTGFAVVEAPCVPVSFDLTGSIDRANGVTINMRAPRPGAGTCPQGPETRYTGLFSNSRSISARGSYTVNCPGELEGEYQFNVILSANRATF